MASGHVSLAWAQGGQATSHDAGQTCKTTLTLKWAQNKQTSNLQNHLAARDVANGDSQPPSSHLLLC